MHRTLGIIAVALLASACERVFSLERTPIDARMLSPGCSGMRMLADDFEDGDLNPLWPQSGASEGVTVSETGGALQIAADAQGVADVHSMRFYDLRDDHFSVEVRTVGDTFPATDARIEINLDAVDGRGLRMSREGSMLYMDRVEGGDAFEVGAVPYDPVAHRFWRIAQTGDTVTWETSPDDQTYTQQASFPGTTTTFMRARFRVLRLQNAEPFTVRFDQANGGSSTGEACKAFGLTDDFEDGVLGAQWARGFGDLRSEQNGQLTMGLPADGSFHLALMTSTTFYDLRDDALSVEIPQPLPANLDLVFLEATTLDGSRLGLYLYGGGELRAQSPTAQTGSKPYDPVADRWWRIRSDAGRLFWETSPDGTTYTPIGEPTEPTDLDRVDVNFGLYGTPAVPVTATFDNFNIAPP